LGFSFTDTLNQYIINYYKFLRKLLYLRSKIKNTCSAIAMQCNASGDNFGQ